MVPNPIIQKYAGYKGDSINNEYTCGIFTLKEGDLVGPFIAKRILKNGTSWIIEVAKHKAIKSLIINIANKLKSIGSLNIQLRDGPNGPIPIEFNARFSGTTNIRAYFGFNEQEMFIKNYFLGKKIKRLNIKNGKVFRYTEEIFLENLNLSNKKNFNNRKKANWF